MYVRKGTSCRFSSTNTTVIMRQLNFFTTIYWRWILILYFYLLHGLWHRSQHVRDTYVQRVEQDLGLNCSCGYLPPWLPSGVSSGGSFFVQIWWARWSLAPHVFHAIYQSASSLGLLMHCVCTLPVKGKSFLRHIFQLLHHCPAWCLAAPEWHPFHLSNQWFNSDKEWHTRRQVTIGCRVLWTDKPVSSSDSVLLLLYGFSHGLKVKGKVAPMFN